jgi:hypothetical protein
MPRSDQNTKTVIWTPTLAAAVLLVACGGGPAPLTYASDVKPIVDEHCSSCHREGGIAPFALTTYEQVRAQRFAMVAATRSGAMPPVLAAQGCAEYANDERLDEAQLETLSAWAGSDALEGTAVESTTPAPQQQGLMRVDLSMPMPITYVPVQRPDDYRCFVIDWPKAEDTYVVGFRANPGNAKVVHHVIAYLAGPDQAAEFEQLDAAEPGPGYTCFGGANGKGKGGTGWLGAWAPGAVGGMYPADTGILVKPGSKVILQVHYNTLGKSGDLSDLTSVEVALASSVKRKGAYVPFTNFDWILHGGMTIPAQESDVVHSYALDPTPYWGAVTGGSLPSGVGMKVYSTGAHQHLLGTKSRQEIRHADGSTECLLDIPRWDFHWQQTYWFSRPKVIKPGDQLSIECHWDNSAAHQPVVDGKQLQPRDVDWGESTTDEMCLGLLYVAE